MLRSPSMSTGTDSSRLLDDEFIDDIFVEATETPTTRAQKVSRRVEGGLTVRALAVGCGIGWVVAAMNIAFGLKTGWTQGGSVLAAVVGIAVFRAIKPKEDYTKAEANITQTCASAAGVMTGAAGFVGPIPALKLLGHDSSLPTLLAWAASVAYIGVFFAVPLRRRVIVKESLRFPTGTATAEIINATFAQGGDAVRKAKRLLICGAAAGAFTLLVFFVPYVERPPLLENIGLAAAVAYGFNLYIDPMLMGGGMLCGWRIGNSMLLSTFLGWALAGPLVRRAGWAPGEIMSYKDGVRAWLLWCGVALMTADALMALVLSLPWKSFISSCSTKWKERRGMVFAGDSGRRESLDAVDDSDDDVPASWWIGGLCTFSVLTSVVLWRMFGIDPWLMLIAIPLAMLLGFIAVKATGETDINPIGGMGKVTQLIFAAIAPGNMIVNLMTAAVSGAGANQAGDMMQDFKTGYILGVAPRYQFIAQCVGIFAGIWVSAPIYKLFDAAYEFGSSDMPAPAAQAWRAVAEVLANGLKALPKRSEVGILVALGLGISLPLLAKFARRDLRAYVPSATAMGIALIILPEQGLAIWFGALFMKIWLRKSRYRCEKYGFASASGVIAGAGIMSVVSAALKLAGVRPLVGDT